MIPGMEENLPILRQCIQNGAEIGVSSLSRRDTKASVFDLLPPGRSKDRRTIRTELVHKKREVLAPFVRNPKTSRFNLVRVLKKDYMF